MLTAKIDKTGFNRGMKAFVERLGIEGRIVLKKEMGELVKTLVRLTPAAEGEKIKKDVVGKIANLDISTASGAELDAGDVKWYAADSRYLFGFAADKDMRKASVEDLRALYNTLKTAGRGDSKRTRQILPFLNRRGTQRVALLQNVFTTKAQRNALIRDITKSRGRLKAGWMAAVFFGTLRLSGGNQPPGFVTRHASGVKGYFIDGLGIPNHPTFTIGNTAAGIGNKRNGIDSIVVAAMSIRTEAMKKNLTLFMKGKKHLSDYAK